MQLQQELPVLLILLQQLYIIVLQSVAQTYSINVEALNDPLHACCALGHGRRSFNSTAVSRRRFVTCSVMTLRPNAFSCRMCAVAAWQLMRESQLHSQRAARDARQTHCFTSGSYSSRQLVSGRSTAALAIVTPCQWHPSPLMDCASLRTVVLR